MHWHGASLTLLDRGQVKVKLLWRIVFLNKSFIDQAPRWWVAKLTLVVLNKESLTDPFVYDDYSYLRRFGCFIKKLLDSFSELGDLLSENLISLLFTDTVSVDNQIGRVVFVVLNKHFQGFFDWFTHICVDNFLALFLNEAFAMILCHSRVNSCWEPHNRLLTFVTHIYSNQHGPTLSKSIRELHTVQISTDLAIDLSQNIGSFRKIEPFNIFTSHNLRGHLILK